MRSSLKAYRTLFSTIPASVSSLTPFSAHLRYLVDPSGPEFLHSRYDWRIPGDSIRLLELRAALIVRNYAHESNILDTTVNQRIAGAVTEAFVARQVGNMIQDLSKLGSDGQTIKKLYLLVRFLCILFLYLFEHNPVSPNNCGEGTIGYAFIRIDISHDSSLRTNMLRDFAARDSDASMSGVGASSNCIDRRIWF